MSSLVHLVAFLPGPGIPEIVIILLWIVAPLVLYLRYSIGLPNRVYWIPVIILLGWIGYALAMILGPKPRKSS